MARRRNKRQQPQQGDQRPAVHGFAIRAGSATRRLYLILTAFCSGGSVMIIELAGNRILAPWCGNSLYTWTGLIGVILISISCGYYLGGYLADRRPDYAVLAHLLTIAAVLTVLVPGLQSAVDEGFVHKLGVIWGPVVTAGLLFALPGCLLAAVSPFAVRLTSLLWQDKSIGLSAGSVGMAGTLGSVLGTFAAGFLLIPHLRLKTIFLLTGLVLAVLAVAGYCLFAPQFRQRTFTVVFLAGLFMSVVLLGYAGEEQRSPVIIFEKDTFYHRIQVVEKPDRNRKRTLVLDTTSEGSQYVNSKELPAAYQRYWELARLFCPHLKKAAFLGGGAYTMPEALLDAFPDAEADVVEIDPAVIDVGRKYFRVDQYPKMRAVADDARRFLSTTQAKYDLIFGDAYRGEACIPAHLATREFFELVKSRLNRDGVFIVNVVSAIDGDGAIMFHSVAKTLAEVFEFQSVFATDPQAPRARQNVFIVAAEHDVKVESLSAGRFDGDDRAAKLLEGYLAADRYDISAGLVFTDDCNPVEYLVARTLREQ